MSNVGPKLSFTIITARKRSLGQGNIFTGVCLSTGGSSSGGSLCPGWSLSRGVYIQGGLCPIRDLCPGGSLSWGSLSRVTSVRETPRMVKSGRYASYWNAFLFCRCSHTSICRSISNHQLRFKIFIFTSDIWGFHILPDPSDLTDIKCHFLEL